MSYIFCNIRRKKAPPQPSVWTLPTQGEGEQILSEFWVGHTTQERQVDFLEHAV